MTGDMPLTERETSPSELGPENVDLSSFDGSYRMWRRLVSSKHIINAYLFTYLFYLFVYDIPAVNSYLSFKNGK